MSLGPRYQTCLGVDENEGKRKIEEQKGEMKRTKRREKERKERKRKARKLKKILPEHPILIVEAL